MAYQMAVALSGGEESNVRRKTAEAQNITKIANRPSKRQRLLDSVKAENIAGKPELLYKGEDLKRGRR